MLKNLKSLKILKKFKTVAHGNRYDTLQRHQTILILLSTVLTHYAKHWIVPPEPLWKRELVAQHKQQAYTGTPV